jgi:4,5-dihydroxyphthalate decarboxylase
MTRFEEFDAAEMSLSSYTLSLFRGSPFIAIPVFPSRAFRHNGIYVNTGSGIDKPADLVGRLVGVPEYQVTAAVWIRGILADRHDVPIESVRYRTGGIHAPGRVEKVRLDLPDDIEVEPIPTGRTLSDMLVAGEIDALYSPRTPRPYAEGRPEVRRLFADPRTVEEEYFTQTGIFPIMHVIALRRDVYERNRWVARALYDAFEAARGQTAERLAETAAARCMLPWLYNDVERTRELMGADFWSYGLESNETTLRTFLRYSHVQGLAERRLEPADLFAPETLEAYVI